MLILRSKPGRCTAETPLSKRGGIPTLSLSRRSRRGRLASIAAGGACNVTPKPRQIWEKKSLPRCTDASLRHHNKYVPSLATVSVPLIPNNVTTAHGTSGPASSDMVPPGNSVAGSSATKAKLQHEPPDRSSLLCQAAKSRKSFASYPHPRPWHQHLFLNRLPPDHPYCHRRHLPPQDWATRPHHPPVKTLYPGSPLSVLQWVYRFLHESRSLSGSKEDVEQRVRRRERPQSSSTVLSCRVPVTPGKREIAPQMLSPNNNQKADKTFNAHETYFQRMTEAQCVIATIRERARLIQSVLQPHQMIFLATVHGCTRKT